MSLNNNREHPIFSMVWLYTLRGLPLGRLSIIVPKASTIRLINSSYLIRFPLKATEEKPHPFTYIFIHEKYLKVLFSKENLQYKAMRLLLMMQQLFV